MKRINFYLFLFIILFFLTSVQSLSAADLTSPSFIIRDPVIGHGGGYGSGATFQLFSSLNPSFSGASSTASFLGRFGFLYFPDVSITPPTPDDGGGGGGTPGLYIKCSRIADFNCDNHVDIFDLSILLYYLERSGPAFAPYDLSEDGQFDLKDISIMFYYWDE